MLNKLKYHSVPVLFLWMVTFAFSLTTLFCPFSEETFGHDAGIFAYIGYALTQGKPLYTGAWDNKGPLLYIIDALGIMINYRYGIFFLEWIALFVTLLFMYKTALFFAPRYVAAIGATLSIMPLTVTLEGGNLSEEWALPFTAIAFYCITKFFCKGYHLKKLEMMTVGACIAAIILIRLNIIMFIAVAVLGVIIVLIKKRQIKTLINTALFAFIGFLIFVAPFAVYLLITDSLSACLDSAYFSTVGMFSDISKMQVIKNVSSMIFTFIGTGGFFTIVLFVFIFPFYLYKTKGEESNFKTLLLICFFGLFATLIGNSVSGARHMHYFMSFIPVLLLPTLWFLKAIYSFIYTSNMKPFTATAAVAAFAFFISINAVSLLRMNIMNNCGASDLSTPYFKVSDYVKTHSSPEDTVQLIGTETAVTSYYRAKRMAASNYFYYANGRFSEEAKKVFANKIFEDIKENSPKIILFSNNERMQDFIQHLDNPSEYQAFLEENYTLDENDFFNITYLRTRG